MVAIDRVVEPIPLTERGLNAADAPFGSPDIAKLTVPSKVVPGSEFTLIRTVAAPPGTTVEAEGLAESAN